ncbi:MAG: hypothetical protein AAFT19_08960 [Pseudomonadota bacterium]
MIAHQNKEKFTEDSDELLQGSVSSREMNDDAPRLIVNSWFIVAVAAGSLIWAAFIYSLVAIFFS